MDLKRLKELNKFMNENDLCELEIEEEGKRIKLKKFSSEQPIVVSSDGSAPRTKGQQEVDSKNAGMIEIKSPMVGTFYRAASPGVKPFIDVGDEIAPGSVVCIIEAMKLMNEIKTEIGGQIAEILVDNGTPIEFGEPLFLVKPI